MTQGRHPLTDGESPLLPRLKARDAAAWAELYDRHAAGLRAYVRRIGGRDPDDLLGETMVQVVRDIHRFTGTDTELRAWLFGVARHRVIDDARRRKTRPSVVEAEDEDLPAPEQEFAMPDRETLSALLDSLTDDQREVVWLRFGADLSVEETARTVGKTPDAVAALTLRALRRMRRLAGQ